MTESVDPGALPTSGASTTAYDDHCAGSRRRPRAEVMQPDLIDATELPRAFVTAWRALEANERRTPATLAPIFVRDVPGDVWIALEVDGARHCVARRADLATAAADLWKQARRTR